MNRRGFITGLVALGVTAPAIVRAGSLMPVRGVVMEPEWEMYTSRFYCRTNLPNATWRLINQGVPFVKNDILNDLVFHA